MILYVPLQKGEDRQIDDIITTKLLEIKIPLFDDIKSLLGDEASDSEAEFLSKSFYLPLILLYDLERREAKKPSFLHPYSVAAKPDYRYNDPNLPSGFRQTTFQKCLSLNHETREDFGKNIVGYHYIIADCEKHILGEELDNGLRDLTNKNALVRNYINKRLKSLTKEKYIRLEPADIKSMLKKESDEVKIDEQSIIKNYSMITEKLKSFVKNILKYHSELSSGEKNLLAGFINEYYINPLSEKLSRGNIIDPRTLNENVMADFEYVMNIVDNGPYVEADPELIHPSESPYIISLDKTLYNDFLDNMIKRAHEKLNKDHAKNQLSGESLSVPIVKVSDSIAVMSTLESDLIHAIHQFRKSRMVRKKFGREVYTLKEANFNPSAVYQGLEMAVNYLDANLKLSLIKHYKYFTSKDDTSYSKDIHLLEHMLKKEGIKQPPAIIKFFYKLSNKFFGKFMV